MVEKPIVYIRNDVHFGNENEVKSKYQIITLSRQNLDDFLRDFDDYFTRENEWKNSLISSIKKCQNTYQIDSNYEYLFTECNIKIWVDLEDKQRDYIHRDFAINNLYIVSNFTEAFDLIDYFRQLKESLNCTKSVQF